jgi:hypothetical protein
MLTLTVLEVINKDMKALAFDAVIFDDDAAAAHNFSGIPVAVNLAETSPGSKLFGVRNFDNVDLMFGAESLNEFNVLGFRASLDEDTQMGLHVCPRLSWIHAGLEQGHHEREHFSKLAGVGDALLKCVIRKKREPGERPRR